MNGANRLYIALKRGLISAFWKVKSRKTSQVFDCTTVPYMSRCPVDAINHTEKVTV
jgi:hypothetical protein